ncbi:uncharacterized protein UV8b_03121 [Ustilaginoidea virens]|uniref:Phospholipase/carboxylesterase/thioesterase domain-containing protein n=1 Tax=Ustilaginoidea virens TaxID=1159556 RepID=A0A063C388_USTVR|nr:uncharacterized protein UV8b_03121 [Ustilaginoidea virens]QUC18880.1 hypothetical protein UV8b_03121 [Ustilaginoidea virens]GAO18579.1 hypothetical protein UVI_02021670 [Ustilaginoidea virens]
MPPKIPTQADLAISLPLAAHFPNPPESTTAFLILFHGLGDSETPFAAFARNLALPGVLAIAVRGTSPLASLVGGDDDPRRYYHWGDDLALDPQTGELDPDPGFETASRLVMEKLIRGVIVDKCGWETSDVMLFGFGQGGSLALGMAARLAADGANARFKGVVSVGGALPMSMVSSRSGRGKGATHALLCQVGEEGEESARREFQDVAVVRWARREVGMPTSREEAFPIIKFFADRLKDGWV